MREGALEKKWNWDCMKRECYVHNTVTLGRQWTCGAIRRFLRGHTNVLVASDVLEEGIDIQKCNLVVKFDVLKLPFV
jgi:excinuclease UvrABC helicase subunit UvrB